MEELNNKELQLQGLIERAVELQHRISDQITDSISYCKLCCEQGRLCCILESDYKERERLIGIRDSLKDVETLLLYLQSVRKWQLMNWNAAVDQLEESRQNLMEKTSQYRGRALEVVQELNACFSHGKIKALKSKARRDGQKRQAIGFLISFVGSIFKPWKWRTETVAGIALRLLLVSASVSSTTSIMSRRRVVLMAADSRDDSTTIMSCRELDVLHGRG